MKVTGGRPAVTGLGAGIVSDLPSLEDVGKTAAKRTLDLMGGKKIATETLPVILENRGAARVLSGLVESHVGRKHTTETVIPGR